MLFFPFISVFPEVPEGIDFKIRYYNKKIYFPENPVLLKMEIINNSTETLILKIADSHVFNLDFEVKTLTNIKLKHSDKFNIDRYSNQPVFFREISLEPGEEYAFTEDLSNYIDYTTPGVYIVRAFYYPELNSGSKSLKIYSNELSLSVRPTGGISEMEAIIEDRTGEILKKEALPPDKVVSYTLHARQKSQWKKFFLYIDIENFLMKNDVKKQKYIRLSEIERRNMLQKYKNRIIAGKAVLIDMPTEFRITKTTYNKTRGQVEVFEKFDQGDYVEKKMYIYFLVKKNDIWRINNYLVTNLGTE